jgi:hypothetical protein
VVLRGAELAELASELWILAGLFVLAMTLAIARFNKRLD